MSVATIVQGTTSTKQTTNKQKQVSSTMFDTIEKHLIWCLKKWRVCKRLMDKNHWTWAIEWFHPIVTEHLIAILVTSHFVSIRIPEMSCMTAAVEILEWWRGILYSP